MTEYTELLRDYHAQYARVAKLEARIAAAWALIDECDPMLETTVSVVALRNALSGVAK